MLGNIDLMLALCDCTGTLGKQPEKPYSGKVMLRVDPSVHAQIALAAQLTGRSINQLGEEALRHSAAELLPEFKPA
jgi:predicted HicB family RNase H-like nuclease